MLANCWSVIIIIMPTSIQSALDGICIHIHEETPWMQHRAIYGHRQGLMPPLASLHVASLKVSMIWDDNMCLLLEAVIYTMNRATC